MGRTIDLNIELWPRQLQALRTPARELLFGGATEGGKSHMIRMALIIWCLAIPGLQCVLVRKKYDDILKNHVEGPNGFRTTLSPLIDCKRCAVTDAGIEFFHNVKNDSGQIVEMNSVIAFVHCQDERQFDSAQGVEKHVLVMDEATQISERLIRFFRTWVRMDKAMKNRLAPEWQDKFPRIIYTANPIGPSVPFFRRNFVEKLPHEQIKLVDGFPRQYLLSRYTDNPSVDKADHEGRLQGLNDEQLARALDLGIWDAIVGEFFPMWDEERHVVADFIPPKHWFRYRSGDTGQADPAAFYWIGVSDGEPFKDSDGDERWFPRGARIFYQELYIAQADDPAKGIHLSCADTAGLILERSEYEFRNVPTLTDSKPFQATGGDRPADMFQKAGVILTQVDTGPGSRVAGWSLMRDALVGVPVPGFDKKLPMVYFCECCKHARDYIPALSRHPSESKKEDAAEHGEATHSCDAIRYGLVAHAIIREALQPTAIRIERALKSNKPTMKRILQRAGHSKVLR